MQSAFSCNQKRNEKRVLRALWKVDWKLSNCFQITLRKTHSSSSSEEPLQTLASSESFCCLGEEHVLPSHRDSLSDSSISHLSSVTALLLCEQVISTRTNAKHTVWPHSTCNVIQGSLTHRHRGVGACTQGNSEQQWEHYTSCQNHLPLIEGSAPACHWAQMLARTGTHEAIAHTERP